VRGVFARARIAKGTQLRPDLVHFAMPCQGAQTSAFEYHESMVASTDYEAGQPIHESRVVRSKIDMIRGVIHDIKGMLYEANIAVGKEFRIEISHHYGMERFRQHGAVIVEIINRSYCKKLVIVLAGQMHPTHAHRVKEETFQLLWGDLDVTLNDTQRVRLRPGDSLLVEPGMRHSFGSTRGAIIEEVSTTHVKGDSYYDDPAIAKLDLLERKTIVQDW
jgi:N-acetylneuraminate synthase